MKHINTIKSQLALEIMQLPDITFDYRQDNGRELLDLIESNGYCEPSQIGSTAEAYDLVWSDLAREYAYEMPDFSGCNSSLECVEAEGQAVLDGVYYYLKCELVKEVAEALDECFSYKFENDLELLEMKIGRSGLGHIPHDYEVDIAEGSMCVWLQYKMVEVTTNGVTLCGKLETMEI